MNEFNSAPPEAVVSGGFRRNFRYDVNIVMLSSLIMLICVFLDDFIMLALRSENGFIVMLTSLLANVTRDEASGMLVRLADSAAFQNICGIAVQLIMLLFPALIARKALISKPKPPFPLAARLPEHPFAYVGMTFGTCYTVNVICSLLFGSFYPSIGSLALGDTIFGFISVVIIAPIFEEFVFRGIFFRSLAKYDRIFAVFFTAAVFGLIHREPASVINGFVFGVFAAIACAETDSLLMGIMLHMTNNALSFASTSLLEAGGGMLILLIPLSVFSVVMISCVFVMFINKKTAEKPFFTIQKHVAYATPRITGGYKFITLIGSIWSWFFIILLAYSIKLLYG